MAERSNALVLKTSIPQGIGGSNPPPTAVKVEVSRDLLPSGGLYDLV